MAYIQLPTRVDGVDFNVASDPNQLQKNIEALKGGNPAVAPTTTIEDLSAGFSNNLLINGDFEIAQEGTSGTALFTSATTPATKDDTYLLDEWILLSDTDDIVEVSQFADTAINRGLIMRSEVKIASKKFGFVQIKENKDIKHLIGNVVSLSIKIRRVEAVTSFIDNIRIGIIGWDGAVDAPLSDVVLGASWGAAGANPTLAVDWDNLGTLGFLNTPADIPVTTSFVQHKIENVSIPTGTENLGIFIWCDSDDVDVGNILDLAEFGLNKGSVSGTVQKRPFEQELTLCQRYFEKTYNLEIAPGTASTTGIINLFIPVTIAALRGLQWAFATKKRATPTITWYSESTGTKDRVHNATAATDLTVTGGGAVGETSYGFPITSVSATANDNLAAEITADSRF